MAHDTGKKTTVIDDNRPLVEVVRKYERLELLADEVAKARVAFDETGKTHRAAYDAHRETGAALREASDAYKTEQRRIEPEVIDLHLDTVPSAKQPDEKGDDE